MFKHTTLLAAVLIALTACAPAATLPPLTPEPASGVLAGARILLTCLNPGGYSDVLLCRAYEKAYSDVGVVVVARGDAHALQVTVSQPLSEWGAANHCYVTTVRGNVLPGRPSPSIRMLDLLSNCNQPNVADHVVAAWIADPTVASAAAESR